MNDINRIIYFDFTCFKCQENFRIHLKYIKDKKSIICPNCGEKLPTTVLESLKQATDSIDQAIINLKLNNEYDCGWNFSLHWDLKDHRPEKPDAFNVLKTTQEDIDKYHKPFDY